MFRLPRRAWFWKKPFCGSRSGAGVGRGSRGGPGTRGERDYYGTNHQGAPVSSAGGHGYSLTMKTDQGSVSTTSLPVSRLDRGRPRAIRPARELGSAVLRLLQVRTLWGRRRAALFLNLSTPSGTGAECSGGSTAANWLDEAAGDPAPNTVIINTLYGKRRDHELAWVLTRLY